MPAVALRLASELPCRTHIAKDKQSAKANPWSRIGDAARVRIPRKDRGNRPIDRRNAMRGVGRGGNNSIPILIDGKRYASRKLAMRTLHVSFATVNNWLDTGRATQLPKGSP